MTIAVLYAAKSTEDKHDSIPDQIADAREMCQREGWEIVGEYHDENFSAYSGNRGPGLARARSHAAQAAVRQGDVAMFVVQHSDRISRGAGDEPAAAEALVEIWHAERRRNVHLRSVEDDFDLRDSAAVASIGARNHADSKRKSTAVRKGLRRRKERGQPVGPVPFGFTTAKTLADGIVVTERVIDPVTAEVVITIFTMVAGGSTSGAVARHLNAQGITTKRGKTWAARPVRDIIRCRSYLGENGYPQLIDADLWQRSNQALQRLDPSAVQRRKGGRPPTTDFLLRGLAFCSCGQPLHVRTQSTGRVYVCAAVRESRGTCTSPNIPAELAERHVLEHLEWFIGSVEDWLGEKVAERSAEQRQREALIEQDRERLRGLERQRDRAHDQHRRLLDEDPDLADVALRQLARIEADVQAAERTVTDSEARAAEWTGPPTVDAALDYYNQLVALVEGKVKSAKGARELNIALGSVIAGIWMAIEAGHLRAEFQLRPLDDSGPSGLAQALSQSLAGRRMTLPPAMAGNPDPIDLTRASLSAQPDGSHSSTVGFRQRPSRCHRW